MAEIFNLPTKEQFDAMNTHISALSAPNATNVEYSNTTSGLTSNNAQGAIDELADRYSTVSSDIIIRNNDLDEPLANAIPLDADLLNGENPDYYAKQTDVSTLNTTVGNEILSTTAQTLTGAINEHEAQINSLGAKQKSQRLNYTRDATLAGKQTLSGLLGIPRKITVIAGIGNTKKYSYGIYSTYDGLQIILRNLEGIYFPGYDAIVLLHGTTLLDKITGIISNVTATSFDIDWTVMGTPPTGTIEIAVSIDY